MLTKQILRSQMIVSYHFQNMNVKITCCLHSCYIYCPIPIVASYGIGNILAVTFIT